MDQDSEALLGSLADGNRDALNGLLACHRAGVRAAVTLRMDDQLRARVDESDIVQEASMVVSRRIDDFLERRPMTFRLWFRETALECLLQARRKHLLAERRAVGCETSLDGRSALILADRLVPNASPSSAAMAHERAERVRQAVDRLAGADREIILLRVFEGLSNAETATLLNLHVDAASKRLARALLRLKDEFRNLGLSG